MRQLRAPEGMAPGIVSGVFHGRRATGAEKKIKSLALDYCI